MSKPAGSGDARRAAEIQSQLFKDYAAVGLPALSGALGYTRGALAQGGLPSYVENAYRQAQVGALEQNVHDLSGLRRTIAGRGDASRLGGAYLSGIAGAAGSAGDAFTREAAGIRTSRAVAGVEQRNKLLGLLAGGAATGTSLSVGFGGLGNQAIALERRPDQTGGLIAGGLSLGTGLYSALSQPNASSGILGFNPNASGNYNPYLDVYQGGGGTVNLTTAPGRTPGVVGP